MTVRDAYLNILVELNKVLAPSLLVDDFIYLFNKGVQQYINERYNVFEIKQQLTDDLRVLIKSSVVNKGAPNTRIPLEFCKELQGVFGPSYRINLPEDYVHILNCTCEFDSQNVGCNNDIPYTVAVNKLNTNQWALVVNNYYLKPSIRNPYYYIINIDNPQKIGVSIGISDEAKKTASSGNVRYGNNVQPVMQIKCGDDGSHPLQRVYIDYLRAPRFYSITLDLLDEIVDTTQIIEFPDYVTYEIINRIVRLIMENGQNLRVQSHAAVNTSIA